MMLDRRQIITGLISLVAAPAIVRAGSLMPVRVMIEEPPLWTPGSRQAVIYEIEIGVEFDDDDLTICWDISDPSKWRVNPDGLRLRQPRRISG